MMFLDTSFLNDGEITLRLLKTKEGEPDGQQAPEYSFIIVRLSDGAEVGGCRFRVGHGDSLYYAGNIGYQVHQPYRGSRYAGKACKLLLGLARRHGMDYLYITCDPDNGASRRTCERLGGTLEAIVDLPEDNDMYLDGERQKCVYRFPVPL